MARTDVAHDGKRIQFEFSPQAFERLQRLKQETDAQSYAELVRNALRVYEFVIDQEKKGNKIGLIDDGKVAREIKLFL